MRRKEREMSEDAAILDVIRRAQVCRLAMCDGDRPYLVPLCFGYRDRTLYLHVAKEGRKIDIIRKNNRVCFEFEADLRLVEGAQPCDWTMHYKSVIGFGVATLVEGAEEKAAALNVIMQQYTEGDFVFPAKAVERTAIIEVAVESMGGKKSGY